MPFASWLPKMKKQGKPLNGFIFAKKESFSFVMEIEKGFWFLQKNWFCNEITV